MSEYIREPLCERSEALIEEKLQMSDPVFQEWDSIDKWQGLHVVITLKMHGSNGQLFIYPDHNGVMQIAVGKRTGWCTEEQDNFGMAKWANENKEALIAALGHGRHFFEWVGPGINTAYNLKEKTAFLFNIHVPDDKLLPTLRKVPVLYNGPYNGEAISEIFYKLKTEGHPDFPGFLKHEGIVIHFPKLKVRFKKVFAKEETAWDRSDKTPEQIAIVNKLKAERNEALLLIANPFLQPIRLEKLIMRDEFYIKDYPKSLTALVKDYIVDLSKETPEISEEQMQAVKKTAFNFVKEEVERHVREGKWV